MAGFKEYRRNPKSMSDVATNGTPVVEFPSSVGQIDFMDVYYTEGGDPATQAEIEANIISYELMFGGDSFGTYKPANTNLLNAFYGRSFEPGYLTHFFTEEWRQNTAEAEISAFIPGLFVDPALRIVLGAAVSPAITHWLQSEGLGSKGRQGVNVQPEAVTTMLEQRGFPGLIKHLEQHVDIQASGTTETDFFFERSASVIRGWHFKGANITGIRMLVDDQEVLNFASKRALDVQLERKGFFPQDDVWSIVPEALAGSALAHFRKNHGNAENEVLFKIKTSTTADANLLVEQYEMPPKRASVGG
ncbi:hypothetical protein [Kordiimonas sp.]|uniref:hypothetical protein n=1 Tax=Kordiimonas sp. TaxID=1970157 RepID=UPI003A934133